MAATEWALQKFTMRGWGGTTANKVLDMTVEFRRSGDTIDPNVNAHNEVMTQVGALVEALPELAHLRGLESKRDLLQKDLERARADIAQAAVDRQRAPLDLSAADLPGRVKEIGAAEEQAKAREGELTAALSALMPAIANATAEVRAKIERLPGRALLELLEPVDAELAKVKANIIKKVGALLDELERVDRIRQAYMNTGVQPALVRKYLGSQPARVPAPQPRVDVVSAMRAS